MPNFLRTWMYVTAAATTVLAAFASGAIAAITPSQELAQKGSVFIRFQPESDKVPDGMLVSDGSLYSTERGFGWDQDIRYGARRRDEKSAGISLLDWGVSLAEFSIDLPDGNYLVGISALDTMYPGIIVPIIDNSLASEPVRYGIAQEGNVTVAACSRGGKMRISFAGGREGYPNSVISSLTITPASTDQPKWQSIKAVADSLRKQKEDLLARRMAQQKSQRAAYKDVVLTPSRAPRQTIDLAGDWLFMPSQDMRAPKEGGDPSVDDKSWHVLGVPQFWRPIEYWLYVTNEGASHNFLRQEKERCESFSFDYTSVYSGWYRQWVDVPASLKGKRIVLKFDAVASVAEVFWNGKPVASHIGMFGPFECEVTPQVKYGSRNLLAVFVAAGRVDKNEAQKTAAVAVTVEVTADMLNSLPHGCYKANMAGIWQPVRLEVTEPDKIADVYFKPRLDSAVIETTVDRKSGARAEVRHIIADPRTGAAIYREPEGQLIPAGKGSYSSKIDIRGLKPRLWSPEHPNIYVLKTRLVSAGKAIDEVTTTVGFKTFEARGNRLYLNGKPYFMRGANQPPHAIVPNDRALADKFMKLMHDGNLLFTRFHVGTPSQIWMDAADKYGVGTSVGENWPWVLMGDTPIPDRKFLGLWKQELLDIVRANRNHPSLLLWTISNESYIEQDKDPARRLEKYQIFSDVIKSVRALDPKTPIVFHSGHITRPELRDQVFKPNKIDDGDIDDEHAYYGWYWPSAFHFDYKKIETDRGAGARPLISQEASTGYPDNDTGHGTEKYIRDHIVPQVWVGQQAYYFARPDAFLDIHAQITKEYAEKVRRERTFLSGWGLFAAVNWFKDVYDPDRITPYPVYWEVKKAWQPVLVSLDSPERHFQAGQAFKSGVYICNDDQDRPKLTNLTLNWRVYGQCDDSGTCGAVRMPDCSSDSKCKTEVSFIIPTKLPADRCNMTLSLELLQGDEVISRNDYPLICASPSYYAQSAGEKISVLEQGGQTAEYLKNLGFTCAPWLASDSSAGVIALSDLSSGSLDGVQRYVEQGGKLLVIDTSKDGQVARTVLSSIPGFPVDSFKTIKAEGEFADVLEPRLLAGMDPMDMHWWNAELGDLVRVCRSSFQLPDAPMLTKLIQHIEPHGYIHKGDIERVTSWPAFEVRYGKGKIIVSSMLLVDDPLSKRFTLNLINYLLK